MIFRLIINPTTTYFYRWADLRDRVPPVALILSSVTAPSSSKNLLAQPVIVAQVLIPGPMNFMSRFGISTKGLTAVDPNGPLPKIPPPGSNPFQNLGMKVEENPWKKILEN